MRTEGSITLFNRAYCLFYFLATYRRQNAAERGKTNRRLQPQRNQHIGSLVAPCVLVVADGSGPSSLLSSEKNAPQYRNITDIRSVATLIDCLTAIGRTAAEGIVGLI
jgi:hypothetical protein